MTCLAGPIVGLDPPVIGPSAALGLACLVYIQGFPKGTDFLRGRDRQLIGTE